MTLTEPISDQVPGSYDLAWNDVLRQRIIDRIAAVLDTQLTAKVGVQVIRSPITLYLPGYDPVQPALVLLDAGNTDYANNRQISAIPALLIDVASSAAPAQESEMKPAAYAQTGVPEYWIVRPLECDLLIYSRPDPVLEIYTQLTVIAPDGEVRSPTLPFRATMASFFATDR
jgi:Uma2 family endonuclease